MTTIAPTPVKAPTIVPSPEPMRRLHPDEVCPAQKERVVRTVIRDI